MKILTVFALALLSAGVSVAQDPPSRVARLNWLTGNVSFQPAGVDTWTEATLNYPLTTGDHLYTDTGSRAEVHIGANAVRLNGQSNFGFLNLDDRTVQARFTEGSVELRLRVLEDDDLYEVDTPQAAISLLRTGDYRVDADPGRNAVMVTVWSGEADVSAGGRSFIVHARQTGYFPDGSEPDIRGANPADDFDRFTADRNRRDDRVAAPVHVSQSMAGYEDLDEYGTWSETPEYGWIWSPRVAAGWVPYHEGRWAWVEPWGWTWIDEAPWGFAPFHYGRWAYLRAGWVWVPGAVARRPVYAPALVAFVGGPRFGLSLSIGGGGGAVAWFPLGPREAFYPAYHVSNAYVRQVNITHVSVTNINVNVTNVTYVNQRVPGAVIAMPQQGFVGSRSVREQGLRVQPQQLAQAEVIGAAPRVAPARESVLGVRGNQVVAAPPQAAMTRQVVGRATPPPPPVSFEARRQLIQQNNGSPLAPEQVTALRRQQPAAAENRATVRAVPPVVPAANPAVTPERPAQPERPLDRMNTRPPNVRQQTVNPDFPRGPIPAVPRTEMRQPEIKQPEVARPETRPRPEPALRPVQPEARRESGPAPHEPRAEPRITPGRDERPHPSAEKNAHDQKSEPKKDEKR